MLANSIDYAYGCCMWYDQIYQYMLIFHTDTTVSFFRLMGNLMLYFDTNTTVYTRY
jgi:hypothetical protein